MCAAQPARARRSHLHHVQQAQACGSVRVSGKRARGAAHDPPRGAGCRAHRNRRAQAECERREAGAPPVPPAGGRASNGGAGLAQGAAPPPAAAAASGWLPARCVPRHHPTKAEDARAIRRARDRPPRQGGARTRRGGEGSALPRAAGRRCEWRRRRRRGWRRRRATAAAVGAAPPCRRSQALLPRTDGRPSQPRPMQALGRRGVCGCTDATSVEAHRARLPEHAHRGRPGRPPAHGRVSCPPPDEPRLGGGREARASALVGVCAAGCLGGRRRRQRGWRRGRWGGGAGVAPPRVVHRQRPIGRHMAVRHLHGRTRALAGGGAARAALCIV